MKASPPSLCPPQAGKLTLFPLRGSACGTSGSTESNGFGSFEWEGSEDSEP